MSTSGVEALERSDAVPALTNGGGEDRQMGNDPPASWRRVWAGKGWDVTDYSAGGDAEKIDLSLSGLVGEIDLGTLHEQHFYAIRANGSNLRFPFAAQPFTAMVEVSSSIDEALLRQYAGSLIAHGCVQAICRGEESSRLVDIFDDLAELGDQENNSIPFTSMCLDDEPLAEALQYFVLPTGLASVGLLMVIGGSGDFQNVIQGFSNASDSADESIIYLEEDVACLVLP
ncbi:MAG: hypothetical protein FWG74_01070 [Planctomycetes bacterium]|nr:hypothetical protein [Planctomycetota bacterium]